jgi:hypothetical protein
MALATILTAAVLTAATVAAEKVGPPVQKPTDARAKFRGRKSVIDAAINAMSAADRDTLAKSSDEEVSRFQAAVLGHAKCLVLGAEGHLKLVAEGNFAPAVCVCAPDYIRKVCGKLNAPAKQPKAPKADATPAPKAAAPKAKQTPARKPPQKKAKAAAAV